MRSSSVKDLPGTVLEATLSFNEMGAKRNEDPVNLVSCSGVRDDSLQILT